MQTSSLVSAFKLTQDFKMWIWDKRFLSLIQLWLYLAMHCIQILLKQVIRSLFDTLGNSVFSAVRNSVCEVCVLSAGPPRQQHRGPVLEHQERADLLPPTLPQIRRSQRRGSSFSLWCLFLLSSFFDSSFLFNLPIWNSLHSHVHLEPCALIFSLTFSSIL